MVEAQALKVLITAADLGPSIAISCLWRVPMSDEIKKPEVVNTTEEKPLDEKSLDEVVGGGTASPKLYELASSGKHIAKVVIE
jgi:hypothetical protein